MRRSFAILLTAAAASAWASAQGPTAGPIAAVQTELLRKNRDLLAGLVDRTLDLAAADTPLDRARACRDTTRELIRELDRAVRTDDADRAAELTEYLADVLEHNLTPVVDTAGYPVGSQHEQDLIQLRTAATADAVQAHDSLPHVGRIGQSTLVSAARSRLAAARGQLATAGPAAAGNR